MSVDQTQLKNIIADLIVDVSAKFQTLITQPWLLVHTDSQRLYLITDGTVSSDYVISTSKYGVGCQQDSFKTPVGAHVVAQRFGDQQPKARVFKARQATTEVATIVNEPRATELDLITSRILWLQGKEPGLNAGDGMDSHDRYIYIHGTHEEGLLGTPASHGCVRMANNDIIELYPRVTDNTFVYIQ